MQNYHIFLDTNIVQHTIQNNPNKNQLLALHKLNIDCYKDNTIYLLPQVYNEIEEHNINIKYWIWEFINIQLLDDFAEFHLTIFNDILENIFYLWIQRQKNYKSFIADSIYFLENTYQELKIIQIIEEFKQLSSERLWVNFKTDCKAKNVWEALSNVIEWTGLWNKKYHQFTYKDYFRFIGNFLFDYKNYKTKWEKQKLKVGKDSLIIWELCIWVNRLWINFQNNSVLFISSDYSFVKELNKLKNDSKIWKLNQNQFYTDLSPFFLLKLSEFLDNIILLKLDVKNCLFENQDWWQDQYIVNLIK